MAAQDWDMQGFPRLDADPLREVGPPIAVDG